jgi:hypothetical protein
LEIPLILRSPRPDRLVYAIPGWYRLAMALILAALGAGLPGGAAPGPWGWSVLALVALAGLYQESWVFDAGCGRVLHRVGLLSLQRSTVIPFAAIERFRLLPVVTGTVPGSEAERLGNAAALAGQRADDQGGRRQRHRKPFLDLVLECADGRRYLIDHLPARRAGKLRELGDRAAALCGKPLEAG